MSESQTEQMTTRGRRPVGGIVWPVLIVLAGAADYSNSLGGAFVLDDTRNILTNPDITRLWPTKTSLLGPPWTTLTGRPVAMFSMALSHRLHGADPWGYHLFNVTVHLLAGLTLFGVVRRTLLLPTLRHRFAATQDLLAGLIALLWVVHPLTTSAVTYISQRAESLMGLFYLLTLYCFIRGSAPDRAQPRGGVWLALAVVTCLLGLFTKEPMASVPLLVLLYDRTLLSGSFADALRRRRWFYLALLATWIPLAVLLAFKPHGPDVAFNFPNLTALDYLKTQTRVIVHYLILCLRPWPLILYHGWANIDVPVLRSFDQYAPWAAVVILLMLLTLWAVLRKSPAGLLGAMFFMVLAPSSSILAMPTEVIAEYRMYLPLIAVLSLGVLGLYRMVERFSRTGDDEQTDTWPRPASGVVTVLGVMAAVALGIMTYRRNHDYRTPLALWQDAVSKQPYSSVALRNLGVFELGAGLLDDAEMHLRRSLHRHPNSGISLTSLGMVLEKKGRLPEAVEQYRRAWEVAGQLPAAAVNYARGLWMLGQPERAVQVVGQAIGRIPRDAELQALLGTMLVAAGQTTQGQQHLQTAMQLTPLPLNAHLNIARFAKDVGAMELRAEHLALAARLAPQDAVIAGELAVTL
ncbi:MAG TPA: tetratricopeptide repeat protein, partial [Tepidisphaeraceae bacterium]|nr:tetratricopeptide repeat protein [Tepidisphaeraceae bacterium]